MRSVHAHGPDRKICEHMDQTATKKSLDFWPCYLCCLRDPGSVHHRPVRAMLASLLFEPCSSSSPGHLRPCAPCCVGHAESQPCARSDTAPVVCALRVFCFLFLSPVFHAASAGTTRPGIGGYCHQPQSTNGGTVTPDLRAPEGSRVSEVSDEGVRLGVSSEVSVEAQLCVAAYAFSQLESSRRGCLVAIPLLLGSSQAQAENRTVPKPRDPR